MKQEFLLLLSISPVQSFIEASRKTVDLYNASQILSYVINEVIKNPDFIQIEKVIFPEPSLSSKPNRLLAIIETEDLNQYGECLKKYILQNLILDKAKEILKENFTESCKKQFIDHFQINWNLIEYYPEKYCNLYKTIEREHGAMKLQRDYSSFSEIGRKCALDGKYNVKFYRLSYNESQSLKKVKLKDKQYFYNTLLKRKLFLDTYKEVKVLSYFDKEKKISHRLLQPGEGLSAVSYYKRCYQKEHFPSTAEIALLAQIQNSNIDTLCKINNYFNHFKNNEDSFENHQMLYEENLTEEYFRKNGYNHLISKLSFLQNERRLVENCIKQNSDFKQLHKYYAVLLFDGDSMGAFLSGEMLTQKLEDEKFQEFHKFTSQCLGEFATDAKDYLNSKNRGRAVYAGGEDFLGFINLIHLFDVMQTLREKFRTMVYEKIHREFPLKKELTFSAGVVIAHYKIPLSLVLGQVRSAEKRAKSIDGKNSFAISVIKHSGERKEAVWKWMDGVVDSLRKVISILIEKNFSSNFIKAINQEFALLCEKDGSYPKREKHVKAELERLLERSYIGNKDEKKDQVNCMLNLLEGLLFIKDSSLKNFLDTLSVLDFITRKVI